MYLWDFFLKSGSFPANNSPASYWGLQNRGKSSCQHSGNKQAMDLQGGIFQNANFYLLPVFNAMSPPHSPLTVIWAQGLNYLYLSKEKNSCVLLLLYLACLTCIKNQLPCSLNLPLAVAKLSACFCLLNKFSSTHNFVASSHWLLSLSFSLFLGIYAFMKKNNFLLFSWRQQMCTTCLT